MTRVKFSEAAINYIKSKTDTVTLLVASVGG